MARIFKKDSTSKLGLMRRARNLKLWAASNQPVYSKEDLLEEFLQAKRTKMMKEAWRSRSKSRDDLAARTIGNSYSMAI